MVVDFCLPGSRPVDARGLSGLAAQVREGGLPTIRFHMAVTWWGEAGVRRDGDRGQDHGINTFKHFMAYKGALMVNDDELYNSFPRCAELGAMPLVHAENGDVVAAHAGRSCSARGITGPEGHAYSRPPEVEGEATNRAIMIADMAGAPLYVVHTSLREAHEAIARARADGQARLSASR